jgi:methylated-DNA-[protein]-cysteine S-methyltransferase
MNPGYLAPSPFGDIALCAQDDALIGVFFVGQKYYPSLALAALTQGGVPRVVSQAAQELAEFFSGERRVFTVKLHLQGTPFQQQVWQQLLAIPYGEIMSYGVMAKRMGLSGGHARAVGSANSKNPVSIIVPCHRVIGGSGSLTGYAGGLDRKQGLLALEKPKGMSASLPFGCDGASAHPHSVFSG